jgi:hypothetical protein
MYLLTVLMFLKVYQFRHPDTTASAYLVYAFLGLCLIFETVSYYVPSVAYLGVFVVTYMIILAYITTNLYFGLYNDEFPKVRTSIRNNSTRNKSCKEVFLYYITEPWKAGRKNRIIFFFCVLALNLLMAIVYITKAAQENVDGAVSNVLLGIFMANFFGYLTYYFVMKCYFHFYKKSKSESVSILTWIYFVLALVSGVPAAILFFTKERTTTLSPSQSRQINAECMVMFFDRHDIWHFGSALGLFFTFMTLLTLEDNNTDTAWEDIRVF